MLDYLKVQTAIEFAASSFRGVASSKPTLLHSVRCGLKLMDDGFDDDVVVAGILHDILEDTEVTIEEINQLFGGEVGDIVTANTKDSSIHDANKRREDLIKRCCENSYASLIVKLSDIYDNYLYYKAIDNERLINYCFELKNYLLMHLSDEQKRDPYITSILALIK